MVEKAFMSVESRRELQKLFRLHKSTCKLGLETVSANAGNFDYKNLIEHSPTLQIVMYDARTWVSSRIDQFQQRFKNGQFETEVYLIDPQGDFVKILAEKTDYTHDAQRNKIEEAIARFKGEHDKLGKKGRLRIYFLKFFPTHSVVIGATKAVFTLYGISSGRRAVPTFQICQTDYEKDLYSDMLADVEKLKGESRLHHDSHPVPAVPPAPPPPAGPPPQATGS